MTKTNNIKNVKVEGLCISCGICSAVCCKNAISFQKEGNEYYPLIKEKNCINCGICLKVCPQNSLSEYNYDLNLEDNLLGEYKEIFYAQSKIDLFLKNGTSGGMVTTLIYELLRQNEYDSAFLVSKNSYDSQLTTQRVTLKDDLTQTQKSRYLTVSHENSLKYMIAHPNERIILLGTGCVISGLNAAIHTLKLNRNNYLLLGLFCDKTMNYGINKYFSQHTIGNGRKLLGFDFRTKVSSGWPGDVRLYYDDGSFEDLPKIERMRVKDYFIPERCLYCMDKLNRTSDIAFGDNYIKENSDKKGASSCIIRSDLGYKVWDKCKHQFSSHIEGRNEIVLSQKLKNKTNNYYYACKKGTLNGERVKYSYLKEKEYKESLRKISLGLNENNVYLKVNKDIKKNERNNKIKKILKLPLRIYNKIK